MARPGGELEKMGGDSEKKVRIVGGFTWGILAAVALVLLAVVAILFIVKEKSVPDATTQPDKHSWMAAPAPLRFEPATWQG